MEYKFSDLEKILDTVKNVKLEHDKKEAEVEADEFLNTHDNYDITVGVYDYDGFNDHRKLNGDGRHALMDITGEILVDYLIDYYLDLDYNATAMIKIQSLEADDECFVIEYNGYELFSSIVI